MFAFAPGELTAEEREADLYDTVTILRRDLHFTASEAWGMTYQEADRHLAAHNRRIERLNAEQERRARAAR